MYNPGGCMRKPRVYTNEELELLYNILLTSEEIGAILKIHPITVGRTRKKLGIKVPIGAKLGKPNPNKKRQETRQCIGKDCKNTFDVIQSSKKKFCSNSCQQRTANVAKKGLGSRKIRNPLVKIYTRYARKVHHLSHKTYLENIDIINPNRHPRTLCGVIDGWQLDHIIPIKECFEKGLSIEEASAVSNLRMLPWKNNLMRQYGIQDQDSGS